MPDWPPELLGYRNYGAFSTAGEGSPTADAIVVSGSSFLTTNLAAWAVANKAILAPIIVQNVLTVYQFAWFNGATVAGNVDVGIYDKNFARVVSLGSTAQAGTSAIQVGDIADTTLDPGLYYAAMASDDATATFARGGTGVASVLFRACGCVTMDAAFPLPSTVTPASFSAAFGIPLLVGATEGAIL